MSEAYLERRHSQTTRPRRLRLSPVTLGLYFSFTVIGVTDLVNIRDDVLQMD